MKILIRVLLFILAVGFILWYLGPRPPKVELPTEVLTLSDDLHQLERDIVKRENELKLRPKNAAKIVWADTPYQQTPYSLVYLHGFSASHFEGEPINHNIARRYGMNMYLARLDGHGLDTDEALLDLDVNNWLQSALKAIAIGNRLGEKTIVMSCSTGSTMGIYADAIGADIFAHIMYSPNIDLFDPLSRILTIPYGLQIARMVQKGKYNCWEPTPGTENYWYACQRLEGVVALRQMVDATMTEDNFAKINTPLFIGCYYKNDIEQDSTVSVPAIEAFYNAVHTPSSEKQLAKFPEAGTHVICNSVRNPNWQKVQRQTEIYMEDVLGLLPLN